MKSRSRWMVGVVMAMVAPSVAWAQGTAAGRDSATAPPPLFTRADGWLAGGFVAGMVAVWPLDESIAERSQLPSNQSNAALKNTATVFRELADPGTVIIGGGLYIAGRLTHDRTMADIGGHASEAIIGSSVVGWVLKSVAGRARPRVNIHDPHDFKLGRGFGSAGDYQSFPSGHTLAAFSLASVVTAESGRLWPREQALIGVLTYGGATLSGLSRIYNNAHWASDVMLGAGIGTLTGLAVVRYQHGHPGNWVDRIFLHEVSVAPAVGGGMMVGVNLQR
ncbi:MAG TPA: phosphatase PAP2 family protein [Gemmatimonadaceae bacterium]|nr:phosphatase PAP2 family protein [Gemmatimonadaceae bacterium]